MLLSGELLAERGESLSNNTFQSYYASRKETQGFELGNIYFFMAGLNTEGTRPAPATQTSLGLQGAWLAALWDGSGSDWYPISGLILGEGGKCGFWFCRLGRATEPAPMLAGRDGDLDGACLASGHIPFSGCGQTGSPSPSAPLL